MHVLWAAAGCSKVNQGVVLSYLRVLVGLLWPEVPSQESPHQPLRRDFLPDIVPGWLLYLALHCPVPAFPVVPAASAEATGDER